MTPWTSRRTTATWARILTVALAGCGASNDDNDSTAGADTGGTPTDTTNPATATDTGTGTDPDAGTDAGTSPADDTGTGDPGQDPLQGDLLLSRLPGLWAAPVTSETSAGNFPLMNMDVRAAGDHTLFSRVDLDAGNNLRFAFAYEEHPELGRVLVYRNGGFFQGVLRDTRTRLVEFDATQDTWRFCAIEGGCRYIDAHVAVSDGDALELDVSVLGMHHMHWAPTRVESRPLPDGFVDAPAGATDDPFPTLPTLEATLSWTNAADEGEEAWLILFTEPCAVMTGACNPARYFRAVVQAGQTEVTIPFVQVHAGSYQALAVLDRNGNLSATLLPDPGDAVSVPNIPVTVDVQGTSTAMIPIMFEL